MVIDGLSPQGVDVIPSRAQSYQNGLYYKTMNQHALWNPYIFGGMPTYHSIRAQAFSVDNLLYSLGKYSSNVFTFYILGAIGLFILLRYLKMNPVISFIVVIIFVLLPHYKSLYLEGHFAKFSALMNVPWIILTFLYFQNKRNILSTALFALAFGLQIRTQHYQIVFYTGLLLFAIGVYPFLKDLFEKKYSIFIKSTILLFVALALSILMSAQPLFLAKEYLPYSKRGKTTIDLNNRDSEQNKVNTSDGVTFNYATQWSTAPSELLTWFIPRYYGGMSNEIYKGDAFNGQLKNREIPGYWGQMPFTQSYEYLGVLTLLLAVIGIYAYRKDKFIISLLIFAVFLILLSFGRHFESFYKLFYYYFPFFNKFRAPMMSVTITSLIICILAGYGLRYLLHLKPGLPLINYKNLFIILGSFFAFSIIIWLASLNNSFIKPGENYDQQTITILNTVRKEFVAQDILRYFILITISSAVIMGYLLKKCPLLSYL